MLNAKQLSVYVVRPVLKDLGAWSLAAERLVIGTGHAESGLHYLDQVERGGDQKPGPAYGIFQMEKATHNDILDNYVRHRPKLLAVLRRYCPDLQAQMMQGNLYYAAALCRIHYLRVPEALPAANDPIGMAQYHKKYYNTFLGAADPAASAADFRTICALIW